MSSHGRLRILLAILLVAAVAIAAVLLLHGGSGGDVKAPPVAAAKLVPADALVFVDVDANTGRAPTAQALTVAEKFPGYPALRDSLVAPAVRAWAGREAALALMAGTKGVASSLVLVAIRDPAAAARYVAAHATGTLVAAVAGAFVAIGPADAVGRAVALAGGPAGASLATDASYRRAVSPLPSGRVLTGYATAAGVRRLLAPASGVVGLLGGLLDRPGLRGVGFSLGPDAAGASVTTHTLLDPGEAAKIATFTPTLLDRVPAGATVVIDTKGLTGSLGRLLGLTGGSTTDGGLTALLGQAATGLADRSKGSLRTGVLGLLNREAAAYLMPALPRPILTIVAKTGGELATQAALTVLRPSVARVLAQPNAKGTARVPATWRSRTVDGVTVWTLPFATGSELDYAVRDGRLIVSTSLAGLRAQLRSVTPITATASWKAVMRNLRNPVGSLVFLDFNQLLRLGEQTGLDDSREYQSVRDDLQRIRAVGSTAIPGAGESTAETLLQIP